jgi:hypothetical protein
MSEKSAAIETIIAFNKITEKPDAKGTTHSTLEALFFFKKEGADIIQTMFKPYLQIDKKTISHLKKCDNEKFGIGKEWTHQMNMSGRIEYLRCVAINGDRMVELDPAELNFGDKLKVKLTIKSTSYSGKKYVGCYPSILALMQQKAVKFISKDTKSDDDSMLSMLEGAESIGDELEL